MRFPASAALSSATRILLLTCGAALGTAQDPTGPTPQTPAQPTAPVTEQKWREVRTADGSRFLLVPTGGAPIVHWVMVTPAGGLEDPRGLEALSFAVARAAMHGTSPRGTGQVVAEQEAMQALDALEQENGRLAAAGAVPEKKAAALQAARAAAGKLFDPTAWELALTTAPALGATLVETPDGVALQIVCTISALPRVAQLLLERREGTQLRGVHREFERVRAERAKAPTDEQRTALRREVLALCGLPAGATAADAASPTPLSHARALDVFRRTHHPTRTRHVLTGGFDPEVVAGVLRDVFSVTDLPLPPTKQTPPAFGAERRATITGRDVDGVAIAYALPEFTDPEVAAALLEWLVGGNGGRLGVGLRGRGRNNVKVSGAVPFPGRAGGLLLIETEQPLATEVARRPRGTLTDDILAELRTALQEPPGLGDLEVVLQRRSARGITAGVGPRNLARQLALDWALLGRDPEAMLLPPRPVGIDDVADLARRLLAQRGRAIVSVEVTQ